VIASTKVPGTDSKILLPGGAGLVGQNLVARLMAKGYKNLVVLDKHSHNLHVLAKTHPQIACVHADLSKPGEWMSHFHEATAVVMLQAQIGGVSYSDFEKNNLDATRIILDLVKKNQTPGLIHISSSVVESVADDFYTRSKRLQEKMVVESGISCPILRPTLMFGWFDRKHLGWLSRFLEKAPVFPIPGHGRYMRQPLYAGDFCDIIISCMENSIDPGIYNISGHEKMDYIDIIREIRRSKGIRTPIVKIPYWLFSFLLRVWALFDRNPPFTTQQLKALVARDEFEVIDWPAIFGVRCTPFREAIDETFHHPVYSKVILEF
jgi:nucleoside-diphosphate-sugar epimerase